MNPVFKEPLLVFLLIGAAIFVLFQQVADDPITSDTEIVVTAGHIQMLRLDFEKTMLHLPNNRELEQLIQHYVREEVFYREALALGLDRDDPIIKRHLVQKLKFSFEDTALSDKPKEQQLLNFLIAHQDIYRQPSHFDFRQVFIDVNSNGENAQNEAFKLLTMLKDNDSNAETLGDSGLSHQFINIQEADVKRIFGRSFLQSLREMPTDSWQGPIRSRFGWHLVSIIKVIDAKPPSLNEVRKSVILDWKSLQRKQANIAVYERLAKSYKVTVADYQSAERDEQSMKQLKSQ